MHVYTNGLNKIIRCEVNCKLPRGINYRLLLRIGRKKTNFYGPIFLLPVEDKTVLRLKNRSRTGKTDDFSSPACTIFI